jgi:hypothetical protein|tara:strand:- start:182 stop:1042 length:861 start_codon:yes stop_codon:yes gene_type:complete
MTEIYLIKHMAANDEVYHVSNLNTLNWSINTPVTPMPLPEDSHEENILVKMEGNTAKIDLSWTLTEGSFFGTLNSSDVFEPEGNPDTVLSAISQIGRFKEFVPISIGDSYSIKIVGDGGSIDKGTIATMSFSVSGSSPIVWTVNLAFYIGNVVAMLESDIPPAPTSVTLVGSTSTSADAGTIAYTVVPYDGYATEPPAGTPHAISGHKIKYKKTGNAGTLTNELNTWIEPANFSNALTNTITGLSHGNYTVKIAQQNGFSADAGTAYFRTGKATTGTTVSTTVVVG